jgi:predicted dehydrogenase
MNEIGVGIAGVGYWGSKLVRNLYDAPNCRLVAISDPDPARVRASTQRYPGSIGVADVRDLVARDDVEAVVLATPAALHHEHARLAMEAGKHVLVEKPLGLSSAECDDLVALAKASGVVLMVGHTFLYSEPVRRLRSMIQGGELGDILYIYGLRVNLGVIREDLNALWNFGPHDISILLYLVNELPLRVSARQFSLLNRRLEDVAFLVLEFPSGVVGHVHDSWLDPRKRREFTVVGSSKMAVYDDTSADAPLRIFDKGVTQLPELGDRRESQEGYADFKLKLRAGDVLMPHIEAREPLSVEIEHFLECVATGQEPLTGGAHGREVVAVLEAAERSSALHGAAVDVLFERSLDARTSA